MAVAFDKAAPTVRLGKDTEYKAGRRETPAEFSSQLGLIEEVVGALQIPMVHVEGHEADDAIGTLATRAAEEGIDAVFVTADRDFFQLVGPAIRAMFNRPGISHIARFDVDEFEGGYQGPPSM